MDQNNRALVDSELTSFYDGRQFRIVQQLSIANGTPFNIKYSRGADVIVRGFKLEVISGEIICAVWRNPTIGGTWATSVPVIPKNESSVQPSPQYQSRVKVEAGTGGTFSGGTFRDIMDVKASGGGGSGGGGGSTVGGERNDERGCPANSWDVFSFTNPVAGTATGILSIWWEELP